MFAEELLRMRVVSVVAALFAALMVGILGDGAAAEDDACGSVEGDLAIAPAAVGLGIAGEVDADADAAIPVPLPFTGSSLSEP